MPDPDFPAPPPAVSVRDLSHKPSKAARKEFERAETAWTNGLDSEASRRVEEAIRLDPKFAPSHAAGIIVGEERATLSSGSRERASPTDGTRSWSRA